MSRETIKGIYLTRDSLKYPGGSGEVKETSSYSLPVSQGGWAGSNNLIETSRLAETGGLVAIHIYEGVGFSNRANVLT